MRKVELIPFKAEHLQAATLREDDGGLRKIGGADWAKCLAANEADGPAWTVLVDGILVGAGGIRIFWPGVGEAWAVFPAGMERFAREILSTSRRQLWTAIRDHGLWRVQATARADFPGAQNFLEHLGFQIEANLGKFSPDGVDAFLYAIVR
jgi:hypothetical protein